MLGRLRQKDLSSTKQVHILLLATKINTQINKQTTPLTTVVAECSFCNLHSNTADIWDDAVLNHKLVTGPLVGIFYQLLKLGQSEEDLKRNERNNNPDTTG